MSLIRGLRKPRETLNKSSVLLNTTAEHTNNVSVVSADTNRRDQSNTAAGRRSRTLSGRRSRKYMDVPEDIVDSGPSNLESAPIPKPRSKKKAKKSVTFDTEESRENARSSSVGSHRSPNYSKTLERKYSSSVSPQRKVSVQSPDSNKHVASREIIICGENLPPVGQSLSTLQMDSQDGVRHNRSALLQSSDSGKATKLIKDKKSKRWFYDLFDKKKRRTSQVIVEPPQLTLSGTNSNREAQYEIKPNGRTSNSPDKPRRQKSTKLADESFSNIGLSEKQNNSASTDTLRSCLKPSLVNKDATILDKSATEPQVFITVKRVDINRTKNSPTADIPWNIGSFKEKRPDHISRLAGFAKHHSLTERNRNKQNISTIPQQTNYTDNSIRSHRSAERPGHFQDTSGIHSGNPQRKPGGRGGLSTSARSRRDVSAPPVYRFTNADINLNGPPVYIVDQPDTTLNKPSPLRTNSFSNLVFIKDAFPHVYVPSRRNRGDEIRDNEIFHTVDGYHKPGIKIMANDSQNIRLLSNKQLQPVHKKSFDYNYTDANYTNKPSLNFLIYI